MLLEDLCALAHEEAPEKRRELLLRVSDLFLSHGERYEEKHVVLFEDVISRVLDMVAEDARQEFSEKVSTDADVPRSVILRLAHDTEAVAQPVLRHATQLTDADLVALAKEKGDGHRLAIAERKTLAEAVTDVLVKKGSPKVVATVAGNQGARFSTRGYAELTRRARTDQTLQTKLVNRHDLPPAAVDALIPVLSVELLERLAQQGIDLGRKGHGTISAKVRQRLNALLAVKDVEARQLPILIAAVRDGRRDLGSVLMELAEQDRLADLADILATFTDVPAAQILGGLLAREADTLAVILRSLSLGERVFDAFVQLRERRLHMDGAADTAVFERFKDLRPDVALRAVRFHKVRLSQGQAA